MKSDVLLLQQILKSIKKIEKYTKSMNQHEFENNEVIQDAVIRQFEIIGEASNHLSDNTIQKIDDVPWKDIVGFRNVLIHDYFEVDLLAVWTSVLKDLPGLKASVENYIINQQ